MNWPARNVHVSLDMYKIKISNLNFTYVGTICEHYSRKYGSHLLSTLVEEESSRKF